MPLRARLTVQAALAASALFMAFSAQAGMSYQLDTIRAASGEEVRVQGTLFNDTPNTLSWTPPKELVLQWRDPNGKVVRSLAHLESAPNQVDLPVNNFAAFSWRAVVPAAVQGLQAINIEGESVLLALDASAPHESLVAQAPAQAPIVQAGAARDGAYYDPALPEGAVQAAGASVNQGPPPTGQRSLAAAPSAFEHFRNAISPYEPIYFDLGKRDGTNARFQISFKYRLFTPADASNPGFFNHLYLGYTQRSLWDLAGESKPFIDTTYNPSLFWHRDALWQSPERRVFAGLAAGVQHNSNGKSGADSRSINSYYLEPQLNYRFSGGSTFTFAPRVKSYFGKPDNPDYADYAGYVDWKARWAQDNGLVLTGLYRQGKSGRNTVQLEAAWPLRRTFLDMNGYLHVQYFHGYGETLLGYNQKSSPQVRVGLALVP